MELAVISLSRWALFSWSSVYMELWMQILCLQMEDGSCVCFRLVGPELTRLCTDVGYYDEWHSIASDIADVWDYTFYLAVWMTAAPLVGVLCAPSARLARHSTACIHTSLYWSWLLFWVVCTLCLTVHCINITSAHRGEIDACVNKGNVLIIADVEFTGTSIHHAYATTTISMYYMRFCTFS